MTTIKGINLKLLRTDGNTQGRLEINENVVDDYANLITDGAVFPELITFYDGTDYWLADGFTRLAAAKLAQKASFQCEVRMGTRFDAVCFSRGANGKHGQRLTNADKRNSVVNFMKEEQVQGWSDQRIADMCEVTRQFVFDVRKPELREAREATAKAKPRAKKGEKATKPDAHPGTEEGAVTIVKRAEDLSTVDKQDGPNAAELRDENGWRVLSDEVDRLRDRLAVESMDASEEEKALAAVTIADLRRELLATTAERNALSSQLGAYLRENGELKREVVRMRKKLDQAQHA